ncbi:MAG: hypothetical protein M0Z48_13535 [Nitrospiraceae bacterium]|nr:hypothetical protein [Nitrospiraceae bacterium]
MKVEISGAIEELKRQFSASSFGVREDGQGGAYVVIEPVILGPKYRPESTWVGFHIPGQYPYADIYPVFIGENVVRADGIAFVAPLTRGHRFEGRPAIQISRRNSAAQTVSQKASAKILKVLDYLEKLQ